ncbi:MAG: hypothetical protein LBC02_09875 [Planctomycetaceae bacterium]|nr:hypothetical protein [Planctomycetaceae bacterium]
MAGENEAQRSDRMELPKHSDDEGERRAFRQVGVVTALRSRLPCVIIRYRSKYKSQIKSVNHCLSCRKNCHHQRFLRLNRTNYGIL